MIPEQIREPRSIKGLNKVVKMSYYKRNTASNREALFGNASGSSGGNSRTRKTGMSAESSQMRSNKGIDKSRISSVTGSTSRMSGMSPSYKIENSKVRKTVLSGRAKLDTMKEAEECRLKAKKCMTRGIFSGPDPVSAGMWYQKAARLYQKCGDEDRLERLHRIASGDCNRGCGAWSTAASEYSRAAELAASSDETLNRRRSECHKLYRDAADAYVELGDFKKRGDCLVKAALGLLIEDEVSHAKSSVQSMDSNALRELEEAVEAHVPDPLNPNKTYRQTKSSMFSSEDGTEVDLDLCRQHLVTASYAHETIYTILYALLQYNEYPSALYAAGAATFILRQDPSTTISLSRAYLTETIITLALGDVVAAEQSFLNVHLQNNNYLRSRECKLAEDLIRAIQSRNAQALHDARTSENKSAMANLNTPVRNLVHKLQLTGLARDAPLQIPQTPPTTSYTTQTKSSQSYSVPEPMKKIVTTEKELGDDEIQASLDANFDEMDNLMNEMGLDDDSLEREKEKETPKVSKSSAFVQHQDDDDFDIDLR